MLLGVGGMHVAFVASAAEVALYSSRVEGASEVWLLTRVVKGVSVLSNTSANAIVKYM